MPGSVPPTTHRIGLAELDAIVIQKGTVADQLQRLGVVGRFDDEIAADNFFGLGERSIDDRHSPLLATYELAPLVTELFARDMPAARSNLFGPGLIFLGFVVYLLGREVLPDSRWTVQDQHELRHDRFLSDCILA